MTIKTKIPIAKTTGICGSRSQTYRFTKETFLPSTSRKYIPEFRLLNSIIFDSVAANTFPCKSKTRFVPSILTFKKSVVGLGYTVMLEANSFRFADVERTSKTIVPGETPTLKLANSVFDALKI